MSSSKLSKTALKGLIKECLIEILAEGLAEKTVTPAQSLKETLNKSKQTKTRKPARRRQNIQEEAPVHTVDKNKNLESKIDSVTSDPILAEMLADTAQTTLREQVAADSKRNLQTIGRQGDQAAQLAEANDPEDLFGEEISGKWASLAFS